MDIWRDLHVELDAWQADGRSATLWWRDDDAVTRNAALDRLFEIADQHAASLCVAAIPAGTDDALLANDDWPTGSAIVQHGYAHQNHAPTGEKKCEFPANRPMEEMSIDLRNGHSIISRGVQALAAFVPPWNRISDAAMRLLPDLGFMGISTFGPREAPYPTDGLIQANTHVDPIDWRGHRGYVGDDAAVGQLVRHLSARRLGQVDGSEPTGILTHHLVHDEDCWRFLDRLAGVIADHPSATWLRVDEVFAS